MTAAKCDGHHKKALLYQLLIVIKGIQLAVACRQRALLAKEFPNQPSRTIFHQVEHHLAHLASAFRVSPFTDAAVVSVDGFGDFASAATFMSAKT